MPQALCFRVLQGLPGVLHNVAVADIECFAHMPNTAVAVNIALALVCIALVAVHIGFVPVHFVLAVHIGFAVVHFALVVVHIGFAVVRFAPVLPVLALHKHLDNYLFAGLVYNYYSRSCLSLFPNKYLKPYSNHLKQNAL